MSTNDLGEQLVKALRKLRSSEMAISQRENIIWFLTRVSTYNTKIVNDAFKFWFSNLCYQTVVENAGRDHVIKELGKYLDKRNVDASINSVMDLFEQAKPIMLFDKSSLVAKLEDTTNSTIEIGSTLVDTKEVLVWNLHKGHPGEIRLAIQKVSGHDKKLLAGMAHVIDQKMKTKQQDSIKTETPNS